MFVALAAAVVAKEPIATLLATVDFAEVPNAMENSAVAFESAPNEVDLLPNALLCKPTAVPY